MKYLLLLLISCLLYTPALAAPATPRFAVAETPVPVLNTPDFSAVFGGRDGRTLDVDGCGLIRAMEFVALPGTVFTIEAEQRQGKTKVYRVSTTDYPYPSKTGYYVDSRFVMVTDQRPQERVRKLPPRQEIIDSMLAATGSRYVWGGNVRSGVPALLSLFPPSAALDPPTADAWQLHGVDCSGLLYEATGGFTPRNTSELTGYGAPVAIAGKSAAQIAAMVEPLDLIVWSGHVIIVLDRERTIESRLDCGGSGGGVVVRPLRQTLDGIMKGRTAMNDYADTVRLEKKGFVIRRWYTR